jgi:hypothetical protein
MSKNIEFPSELKALQEAHRRGENLRRQYSMRLNTAHAIAFVRDCEKRNVQPSRRLEELVVSYVEAENSGVQLMLDAETRKAFEVIGRSLGNLDRNSVAKYLISRVLKHELAEAERRLALMDGPLVVDETKRAKR